MKFKVLYVLAIIGLMSFNSHAQRGVRIGYIDTEFILQNVPEYQEASTQLDTKVTQWKSEVDKRLGEIELKKKALDNEKVLLTKELYEERFEDISFEESEVIDYQQKRFGPNGDMIIQRSQLIQPIQDQIYAAVKEIAETRKYDFIFDKNADFLMLYSAERYDVSEQVLRIITRTSKREQASTKKERKALEEEESVIEDEVNPEKEERTKALEDKKALREKQLKDKRLEREKAFEERKQKVKADREARKKATEERRQKAIDARNKRNTPPAIDTKKAKDSTITNSQKEKAVVKTDSTKTKTAKQLLDEKRQKAAKDREDRKKALEERKKKAKEEREARIKKNDSIRKAKANEKN